MTTKTCAAFKEFGKTWSNESGYVKLTYDFANDTGATSHTAYYLGQVKAATVILDAEVVVETAFTGTGAVVKIGTTGVADSILSKSWGDASVTMAAAGAKFDCPAARGQILSADDYVILVISTAAVTAGKLNVYLRFANQ